MYLHVIAKSLTLNCEKAYLKLSLAELIFIFVCIGLFFAQVT